MRVTNSVQRKEKKSKILNLAKGFYGRANRCYEIAVDYVNRKLKYQYRDRRTKKRNMRKLWIMRINAAARQMGVNYSTFIEQTKVSELNRKAWSELASRDLPAFKNEAKKYLLDCNR